MEMKSWCLMRGGETLLRMDHAIAANLATPDTDQQWVEVPFPAEHHAATYDGEGGYTVAPLPIPIEDSRSTVWDAVKGISLACECGGCATPLGRVDTDDRSKLLIGGAVQMATLALAVAAPYTINWEMEAADTSVAHDAAQMVALGEAVGTFVAECHARSRSLRTQINAAPDAAALALIDITAGWPT